MHNLPRNRPTVLQIDRICDPYAVYDDLFNGSDSGIDAAYAAADDADGQLEVENGTVYLCVNKTGVKTGVKDLRRNHYYVTVGNYAVDIDIQSRRQFSQFVERTVCFKMI
jgi:hypothetical protein